MMQEKELYVNCQILKFPNPETKNREEKKKDTFNALLSTIKLGEFIRKYRLLELIFRAHLFPFNGTETLVPCEANLSKTKKVTLRFWNYKP
jgi:hypothetical protein